MHRHQVQLQRSMQKWSLRPEPVAGCLCGLYPDALQQHKWLDMYCKQQLIGLRKKRMQQYILFLGRRLPERILRHSNPLRQPILRASQIEACSDLQCNHCVPYQSRLFDWSSGHSSINECLQKPILLGSNSMYKRHLLSWVLHAVRANQHDHKCNSIVS